ncbi:MAG: UDP-N-acetylmuramate--L-alanine ligase [Bacteroides sp.]|nr:UDP-N-acetylmuramate--L-alanine ligase [Bacillota bacterium]MCM1394014.1 UDP-N-acetylmuramate--L-alanine ligase [[Eubacterium] siraeum]MCM1455769.1 UDP-N-acetylmuramate--L-alanine ligase [Bacteroides sp.]
MTDFKGKKIHFIGIGGVGVNALAKYALFRGAKVSGSDAKFSALCEEISRSGARVYAGMNPDRVNGASAVVYSSAIKEDNVELARARELNIPVFERQDFLREVASEFKNIVGIAGTHGKTTTTAMLAHILKVNKKKFVGMIGGDSVDYGNFVNNSCGDKDIFVVEACEYKRNFLSLHPTLAVVTNVECDHPDCYKDFASVKAAFDEYLSSAPNGIYLKSDSRDYRGERWEIAKSCDGEIEIFCAEMKDGKCVLCRDGKRIYNLALKDGGVYNFKNATFAIVAATTLGVKIKDAISALATFKGVGRRFEHTGNINGVPVVFDFAHHPTEIACVLERASERGKILAIFQPHTYSRTKAYFEDFADVFGADKNIDSLIFMPTYAAREKFDKDFEVDALSNAIAAKYDKKSCVATASEVLKLTSTLAKSHDIVLFIGAGDIYDLKDQINYD